MVKLDKMTGKTVWTSKDLSDTAGYSSITAADVQGVRTYMTFTASAGVGVRASDGKLMFRYPKAANRTANVATPVFSNNKVFFTSAYGTGGGLLDLTVAERRGRREGGVLHAEMRNHHGGVVLVDGYLYGFNDAILTCLEFATGNLMWRDRSVGKGSVTYADGHLYVQSEDQRGRDSRRRRPPATARRDASTFPTRGYRAGRTRWSAMVACTCAIRTRCSCTTSRPPRRLRAFRWASRNSRDAGSGHFVRGGSVSA